MATNPFYDFISGEALTAQPQMSYLAMLGNQAPDPDPQWSAPGSAQARMFGNPFGTSPASRRYFQGQFQNIYDEFLGQQGRMLQGGQMPAQNFTQFLDAFPFTQRYSALPPEMTGRTLSGFAPRVQYSYL
jgi:hypothetical protein